MKILHVNFVLWPKSELSEEKSMRKNVSQLHKELLEPILKLGMLILLFFLGF